MDARTHCRAPPGCRWRRRLRAAVVLSPVPRADVCVCVPGVRHVRRAHACVWTYVFSFRPDDDSAAGDVTILTSKTSKLRPEESSRSTELSRLWSLHARPASGRGAVSLYPQAHPPGGDAGHRA